MERVGIQWLGTPAVTPQPETRFQPDRLLSVGLFLSAQSP